MCKYTRETRKKERKSQEKKRVRETEDRDGERERGETWMERERKRERCTGTAAVLKTKVTMHLIVPKTFDKKNNKGNRLQ